MQKVEPKPGHVFRGMMIRLYPDKETERKLLLLREDLRIVWNKLVAANELAIDARRKCVVREGLVAPRPVSPDYASLSSDAAHEAKEAYRKACFEWAKAADTAAKPLPGAYRLRELLAHFGVKQDYQYLSKLLAWEHEARGTVVRDIVPGSAMLASADQGLLLKV